MISKLETIDNNLKGVASLLFALASHAEDAVLDSDCLLLLANIVCETQRQSEAALNEVCTGAKRERGEVA